MAYQVVCVHRQIVSAAKKCNVNHLSLPQVVELDLDTVVPCCSGPKRPQDRIAVSDMKNDFETCLGAKVCYLHILMFTMHLVKKGSFVLLNAVCSSGCASQVERQV